MNHGLPGAGTDRVRAVAAQNSPPEPMVGLGMPVFNGARHVAQAIESILGQSFTAFELVVCDNASTDETEVICRQFATADLRVRYYRNATNIGAHPNFNRTFELARGKYFKWVPHDDVLHRDFLAACVAALEADAGVVVCQTQLDFIDGEGNRLGVVGARLIGAELDRPAVRFAGVTLATHNCYVVFGLFPRQVLARSMLLESFHGADRALLAQLALRGRFRHVPRPLLLVRDHKERYTRAKLRSDDRAVWHDTRLKGKRSFPAWRLYREYWCMILTAKLTLGERMAAAARLLQWWFVNWNAARMAVDVLAIFSPEIVGRAERLKQHLFRAAPGIDQVRARAVGQRRHVERVSRVAPHHPRRT